jgi:hypothetical protein
MAEPSAPVHVHLILPAEMRDELRETATHNFRSLSGEVRAALAEHLSKHAEPAEAPK